MDRTVAGRCRPVYVDSIPGSFGRHPGDLDPSALEAVLQGGRATADATLTGTLASPRLEARLTADSLTLGGVQQVRGEAQVRLDGRAV